MAGFPDPDEEFKRADMRVDGKRASTRGAQVLAQFGGSFRDATNPHSGSNDVWVTDRLVLRMSRSVGDASLLREAALARLLPSEVAYPPVIATGSEDGHTWMLCERVPGETVWDAWPTLSAAQRLEAIAELWRRTALVGSVSVEAAAAIGLGEPSRYPFNRSTFLASLERLASAGVLDPAVAASAEEAAERGRPHIASAPRRVLHGDIGLSNAMCSNGRLVALLDFEAASIGPMDLDLEYLLRLLSDPLDDPGEPGVHGLPSAESFEGVWETIVGAAQELIAAPGARERMTAYAVLFDVAILDRQLDRGWPAERVRQCSERLVEVAATGGYLRMIWP